MFSSSHLYQSPCQDSTSLHFFYLFPSFPDIISSLHLLKLSIELDLFVLVHSGWHNKIPQTGWIINDIILFLTVLKTGSSRSGGQHSQVLVKALFQVATANFSLCPHRVEGIGSWRGIWGGLLYKDTNPIHELRTSYWALGFQHMNINGTQAFQPQHSSPKTIFRFITSPPIGQSPLILSL